MQGLQSAVLLVDRDEGAAWGYGGEDFECSHQSLLRHHAHRQNIEQVQQRLAINWDNVQLLVGEHLCWCIHNAKHYHFEYCCSPLDSRDIPCAYAFGRNTVQTYNRCNQGSFPCRICLKIATPFFPLGVHLWRLYNPSIRSYPRFHQRQLQAFEQEHCRQPMGRSSTTLVLNKSWSACHSHFSSNLNYLCDGTLLVGLDYAFITSYLRFEFPVMFDSCCQDGYGCRGKDGQRLKTIKCSESALRENWRGFAVRGIHLKQQELAGLGHGRFLRSGAKVQTNYRDCFG